MILKKKSKLLMALLGCGLCAGVAGYLISTFKNSDDYMDFEYDEIFPVPEEKMEEADEDSVEIPSVADVVFDEEPAGSEEVAEGVDAAEEVAEETPIEISSSENV